MDLDHILLIGYGGPRTPGEVMSFLKGMTGVRNIPEEVLRMVAHNYERIGGTSPYFDEVTRFARQLRKTLCDRGMKLPVFTGMKNWHPFLDELLLEIREKGHRKGLAIILNAFPGAAVGARYKESLQAAQATLKGNAPEYIFAEGWYDHELFMEAQAEEIRRVLEKVPAGDRGSVPLVFTFHSLPVKHGKPSGYPEEANAAAALIANRLGNSRWSVVYQSKPVNAQGPWLGPDINNVIRQLAEAGEKRVVVVPLGFFCDHVEILFDLDIKARETAERMKVEYLRAETVIHHPKILGLFQELVEKHITGEVSS